MLILKYFTVEIYNFALLKRMRSHSEDEIKFHLNFMCILELSFKFTFYPVINLHSGVDCSLSFQAVLLTSFSQLKIFIRLLICGNH